MVAALSEIQKDPGSILTLGEWCSKICGKTAIRQRFEVQRLYAVERSNKFVTFLFSHRTPSNLFTVELLGLILELEMSGNCKLTPHIGLNIESTRSKLYN